MWVSLYLTAQEATNALGNAGPLTEVAESSVINSVELSTLESNLQPPIIQSVVSFSTTDAAYDLALFILMDFLFWPSTMHESYTTSKFASCPPQRIGVSLISPPTESLRRSDSNSASNSPNPDVPTQ